MGDRNGENQPLACVPYFLVEARRASRGLLEEAAVIKGGVPQALLISGRKAGLLHPRNYLRKTLPIPELREGTRHMVERGGDNPSSQNLALSKSPGRRDSLEGDTPVDLGTKIRKSSNIYRVPAISSPGH